ncbi:hypothetical protein GCM10027299_04840 [Larkinella ripae]
MTDLDLTAGFPPVSKAAWIQQVIADLKGKPYEALKQPTPDGFVTEPFYTPDDLTNLPLAENQRVQQRSPGWLNVPAVPFQSAGATNPVLRDGLAKGADGMLLDLSGFDIAKLEWSPILKGLKLSETPLWFRVDHQSDALMTVLKPLLPYQLKGGLIDEPIARYLQSGTNPDPALTQLAQATRLTSDSPQFRTLTVSSHVFHNAGATATQELAFSLNTLVELYDHLTETGLPMEQLVAKTALSVSVGTSYCTEIAKLRALRILWGRLLQYYSIGNRHDSLYLHAQTSAFYDAGTSPYTNLLRATTEAMAAVLGGCDVLTVRPYDAVLGATNDEFSSRIARNVSVLLREEAHLDKTLDPAAGSYYLETLTAQLAESAWALFLTVEEKGGLRKAFEQGFIQDAIEQAYQAKIEAVKTGRILVGVTKFRSDAESATKPARSFETLQVLPVLPNRRLAEEFE